MKIAIIMDKQTLFADALFRKTLQKELEAYSSKAETSAEKPHMECEIIYLPGGKELPADIIGEVKKTEADILVTTDLQGFERCTLADNISYNLLDCKQVHLLLHERLEKEHFLLKPLSISMFFACFGDAYYNYLRAAYPNLPYLKKISKWNTGNGEKAVRDNARALAGFLWEVWEEISSLV